MLSGEGCEGILKKKRKENLLQHTAGSASIWMIPSPGTTKHQRHYSSKCYTVTKEENLIKATYICESAAYQASPPTWVLLRGWACRWKQSGSLTSPSQPGFSLCDPSAEVWSLLDRQVDCVEAGMSSLCSPPLCVYQFSPPPPAFAPASQSRDNTDSLSAPGWLGEAFIILLNGTWEAGEEGLGLANGGLLSGLKTSFPAHWCWSAPYCLSTFLNCSAVISSHSQYSWGHIWLNFRQL